MGCFLVCFGSSKDRRKPRSQIKNKVLPRHQVSLDFDFHRLSFLISLAICLAAKKPKESFVFSFWVSVERSTDQCIVLEGQLWLISAKKNSLSPSLFSRQPNGASKGFLYLFCVSNIKLNQN